MCEIRDNMGQLFVVFPMDLILRISQAENESLCLGLSFAAIRSISFFAIGAMPDTHFHVYGEVENADWHRGWMVP